MELTATDIRNHQFATQMRGYDKTEVDTFKEQTAQAIEHLKQELIRSTMELEAVKLQLNTIKQFEETIKGAAIDARRNADATVATARKEAEMILQKTKSEVETVIATRKQRIAEAQAEMEKIELIRDAFLQKVRATITSHLELLEPSTQGEPTPRHQQPPKETPHYPAPHPVKPVQIQDAIEITDSSEIKRAHRETVATVPSKPEHGVTEEANAPSHIISVDTPKPASAPRQSEPTDELAAALKKTFRDEDASAPTVDPELASALEKYQHAEQDNPLGLVGNNAEEHASAKQPTMPAPTGGAVSTEILAKELDEVVAKFAEEMDKASKS